MGNLPSRESQLGRRHKVSAGSRRKSDGSTMSNRFSSTTLVSIPPSLKNPVINLCKVDNHHSLLDKIKHKGHKANHASQNHHSSLGTVTSSLNDQERPCSPHSALSFNIPVANELIDKYTDSQISVLQGSSSQADATISTDSTCSTVNTSLTNQTLNTEESKKAYSSELLLQELYMLCETSPERRRDRDRRHRQHYLSKRTWGSNYRIPLNHPTLIIDWCCATAVWDIELAFEFPSAKIIGIDYESATVSSLTNTVKNFTFQNADIHQGKTGLETIEKDSVDFVMMRDVWLVNSPATKWDTILQHAIRILKPGGYIEIYEQDTNFTSMGPNLTILEQWSDRFYEAIKLDRNTNNELDVYLGQAGFSNIICDAKVLPIGEWPKDKVAKESGYLQKDLTERRFREAKRWYCKFNDLSEKDYTSTLMKAIDECDDYNTTVRSLYYSAQKPIQS